VMEKMEEKGVPIHLRDWATAGSIDLDNQMAGIEEDAELRAHVAEWKKRVEQPGAEEEEEAKLEFINSLRQLSHSNLTRVVGSTINELGPLGNYVFWANDGTLGPLKAQELAGFLKTIEPGSNSVNLLTDSDLQGILLQKFQNKVKGDVAHYLMFRTGLTPVKPTLCTEAVVCISNAVKRSLDQYANNGSVYQLGKLAEQELRAVALVSEAADRERGKMNGSLGRMKKKMKTPADGIESSSSKLYSGVS